MSWLKTEVTQSMAIFLPKVLQFLIHTQVYVAVGSGHYCRHYQAQDPFFFLPVPISYRGCPVVQKDCPYSLSGFYILEVKQICTSTCVLLCPLLVFHEYLTSDLTAWMCAALLLLCIMGHMLSSLQFYSLQICLWLLHFLCLVISSLVSVKSLLVRIVLTL